MSILRLTKSIGRLYLAQRILLKQQRLISSPIIYTTRHSWRSFSSHSIIPPTKDAASIVPVLDQVQQKTTEEYNKLLHQLASQGRSDQAQKLYDHIFRDHRIEADMTTYSELMLSYINDGKYEEAMEIYYELRDHEDSATDSVKDLRLNAETYASMIDSLTNKNNMTLNQTRYDPTDEPLYQYSVQDVDSVIYSNIEGDSQPSLLTALTLFNDMRHLEIQPNSQMYVNMLKACQEQRDDYVLEKLHKLIRMDLYLDPDLEVFNHLMKAYKVVGDGSSVLEIWDMAQTSNNFDKESVSIVIDTCLENGFVTRLRSIWESLESKGRLNTEKTLDLVLNERGYM
ncbi:hypothetical protein HPULCUR_010384 [Helicostylum pulchrum]|uniref:Pentacotripeptide-repeat region of PRORP domain-containing protein n=1 Tax=Helicostylum pulchrum TaxID=562976 RepID=A0ABP9YE18_9FUNG